MNNFFVCSLIFIVVHWCTYANGNINRPLTLEDMDNYIFVRGMWFSKDGKVRQPEGAKLVTPAQWFEVQCMSHETPDGCNETWRQRYWVLDDYYVEGGPVFFQFGGEGPADYLIDNYYWHNYAKEYSAKLIVLEHRFYGFSYPTTNNSFEDLQLLTSQQALADAAYFIDLYAAEHGLENNKWVAFGGSYAGNLAAWFKQKYPTQVTTAVASSGPLEAIYDFPGYLGTVSEIVQELNSDCFTQVYDAFSCMETLTNGTSCGKYTDPDEMLPVLHQCYDVVFEDRIQRESFYNQLGMAWGVNWPTDLINYYCQVLSDAEGTDALEVYGDFLQKTEQGNCIDRQQHSSVFQKSNEVLEFIRSEEGRLAGAAGWFWQTCYEFGYYMSSDPVLGLYGYATFSGDPYGVWCIDEYGSLFTREYIEERIQFTNDFYKGKGIDSECVIFVNGGWDPWHPQGINSPSETSSNNTVVYTTQGGHCDDMNDPTTEEMEIAQAQIARQIGIYFNDPLCNRN